MAVYYKIDGSNCYYTNENKSGYTELTRAISSSESSPAYEHNVIVELYDNKFILPAESNYLFSGALNTTFNDMNKWVSDDVTDMSGIFYACHSLVSVDFRSFNTKNLTKLSGAFRGCMALKEVDLSEFYSRNIVSYSLTFSACTSLVSVNLSNFYFNPQSNLNSMFKNCSALENIYVGTESVDWSPMIDSSQVYDIFAGCTKLRNYSASEVSLTRANNGPDGYLNNDYNVDIYYKVDGSNCYYTNEAKTGYSLLTDHDTQVGKNKNYIVELYNNSFKLKYDSSYLFKDATNAYFNDTGKWDFTKCNNATGLFYNCTNLTGFYFNPASFSGVSNASYLFSNCISLKTITIIPRMNGVKNLSHMFEGCSLLNSININFNTDRATDMSYMFSKCHQIYNFDVTQFDTRSLVDISGFFNWCTNLQTVNLVGQNLASLTTTDKMFFACYSLYCIDAGEIDWATAWPKITSSTNMFRHCLSLPNYYVSADAYGINKANSFRTSRMPAGLPGGYFKYYYKLYYNMENYPTVALSNTKYDYNWYEWGAGTYPPLHSQFTIDTNPTIAPSIINGLFKTADSIDGLDRLDTSNVTNMSELFAGCALTEIDTSSMNMRSVTNISGMFDGCGNVTSFDLSGLKTIIRPLTAQSGDDLFRSCGSIKSIDLRGINCTKYWTSLDNTFRNCSSLTSVNLGGCDFSNVKYLMYTFDGCTKLEYIYVTPDADWHASGMDSGHSGGISSEMFRGCTSLKKWSGVTTSLKANTSNEGYFTSTSSVRRYRAFTKAYEKYNDEWREVIVFLKVSKQWDPIFNELYVLGWSYM